MSARAGRRCVGFDIDHTLAVDNTLERVAFLRLLETIEDAGGFWAESVERETDEIDAMLRRQRGGAFTIDEAARRYAERHGIEDGKRFAARYREIALSLVDDLVVPLCGAKRLIAALRERSVAAAVLSNGWSPLQQRKAARLGFESPVLVSDEIGAAKPNPQAFEALALRFGAPPEEVWYVGDDPHADVSGAKRAGLRALWYNADRRSYPVELPAPDAVASSLHDVLEIVTGSAVMR